MSGRFTFFRQSGWMLAVSTLAGVLMLFLNKIVAIRCIGPLAAEVSVFIVLRSILQQISIPVSGMQSAFAQLAARSHSPAHDAELSGALRAFYPRIFTLWIALVIGCFLFQKPLLQSFQLSDPLSLWFTLLAGLMSLATPALLGVLQGRQDFICLSKVSIVNNLCLLAGVATTLFLFPPNATAAMGGFAVGATVGFCYAAWATREEWLRTPAPFQISAFVRRFLPLTIGLAVPTYMLTEDSQIVQRFFPKDEAAGYMAARNIGTAVIYITGSLTWVLFPKIVRSMALSQRTTATAQAIGATLLIGGMGALVCTLFPELALKVILSKTFVSSAPLVSYFCWSFLPLAVSILLINTLLAREGFSKVPALVVIAVAYGVALRFWHPNLEAVIALLAGFSLLLMFASALLLWQLDRGKTAAQPLGDPPAVG